MKAVRSEDGNRPPIGMALWLLRGGRLPDRVAWALNAGFEALSLLQIMMGEDPQARQEAAAAMRDAGIGLTYHANVADGIIDDRLDMGYVDRVADDVLAWHESAGGIASCCVDGIHRPHFETEMNVALVRRLHGRLAPHGIRVGIENLFGGPGRLCSLPDLADFRAVAGLPDLGILLDAGHANIHVRSDGMPGEETIGGYVRGLPADLLEVHISDNAGQQDEHRALGRGTLDLAGLLWGLHARGFAGPLTVEVCVDILHGQYAADIASPAETDPLRVTRDALMAAWQQVTIRGAHTTES